MKILNKQMENVLKASFYPVAKYVNARARDRFRKPLIAKYKEFIDERYEIAAFHAIKSPDEKPVIVEGSFTYEEGQEELADKLIEELYDKEITFDPEVTIGEVRHLIENSTIEFKPDMTEDIEAFLEMNKEVEKPVAKKAKSKNGK